VTLTFEMSAQAARRQREALRRLHPDLDERALQILILGKNYGDDLAARVEAFLQAT
jgi:hypothetical protein